MIGAIVSGCLGAMDEVLEDQASGQPPGWDAPLRLPAALDRNAAATVVEVDLVAKVASLEVVPGTRTPVWTYNGSLPGPLIRAKVGDRLIVNFVNELPEETTIHWHGLRIPPEMDGVPGHSQPTVKPRSGFRYEFVLPDAGLFWYHPHVRATTQMGDGLYGALLVEDPREPKDLGDELVLVLSDMSLLPTGELVPHDLGGDFSTLFGREGMILVNGKVLPHIQARPGRRQRWRIVNAARSRYFQLAVAGHELVRLGGDGGFLGAPIVSDTVVVIPGERADVSFTPLGNPSEDLLVRWVPTDRGYGSTFHRPEEPVFQIRLAGEAPAPPAPLPSRLRSITPIAAEAAPVLELRLTARNAGGRLEMGINGRSGLHDENVYQARIGETQVWDVINEIDFAHPFHLHGYFFQVLETARANRPLVAGPREWKDTADVPAKGRMRLVVRFDDRPGMWMFHCHILDHADAGMMAMLHVSR